MGALMMLFFFFAAWDFEFGIVNQHSDLRPDLHDAAGAGAGRYTGWTACSQTDRYGLPPHVMSGEPVRATA